MYPYLKLCKLLKSSQSLLSYCWSFIYLNFVLLCRKSLKSRFFHIYSYLIHLPVLHFALIVPYFTMRFEIFEKLQAFTLLLTYRQCVIARRQCINWIWILFSCNWQESEICFSRLLTHICIYLHIYGIKLFILISYII